MNYHPTDPSKEPKERKNGLIFNKKRTKEIKKKKHYCESVTCHLQDNAKLYL